MPVMFVAFYLGRKCTNSDIHLNTEEIFMVKEERERRAWSQEDLAEMSGVSVRTIQRLEGGSRASLETLKCLAAVFSITVEDLKKGQAMAHEQRLMNNPTLTEEDRAALKYAHHLKLYDQYWDDEDGWGEVSWKESKEMKQGREARHAVRKIMSFWITGGLYLLVSGFAICVNWMFMPDKQWSLYLVVGMLFLWGLQAFFVYVPCSKYLARIERKMVERRMNL